MLDGEGLCLVLMDFYHSVNEPGDLLRADSGLGWREPASKDHELPNLYGNNSWLSTDCTMSWRYFDC